MKSPVQNSGHWQGRYISTNAIERFIDAIAQAGLPVPTHIVADGAIQRYRDPTGKPGNRNLWYVLHLDGMAAGAFGDWKSGRSHTWSANSKSTMTAAERADFRRRSEKIHRQRQEYIDQKHQHAATKAKAIWDACSRAEPDHPYLHDKDVSAGIVRQSGDALVVPIVSIRKQQLTSLQFIKPDGSKRMLSGGEKQGHAIPCSSISIRTSRIIICEGWATGRTLAAFDPTARVIAAIDAGNLKAVAVNCRHRWPDVPLVIACDDDRLTMGNPGMTKGRAAAIATSAMMIHPRWPTDAPTTLSDFNDLHLWHKRQGGVA